MNITSDGNTLRWRRHPHLRASDDVTSPHPFNYFESLTIYGIHGFQDLDASLSRALVKRPRSLFCNSSRVDQLILSTDSVLLRQEKFNARNYIFPVDRFSIKCATTNLLSLFSALFEPSKLSLTYILNHPSFFSFLSRPCFCDAITTSEKNTLKYLLTRKTKTWKRILWQF